MTPNEIEMLGDVMADIADDVAADAGIELIDTPWLIFNGKTYTGPPRKAIFTIGEGM